MANERKKRCSTSLVIMEMNIKTAEIPLYIYLSGLKILTIRNTDKDADLLQLSYSADGNAK